MLPLPSPDLRYTPGFVADPAVLFEQALRELAWERRMAARATASCGLAYNYSGMTYPDCVMPSFVRELADRIAVVVGHPITNCLANLYDTADAGMGFHSDSAPGIASGTSTSIVSLGGARELTFRSKSVPRRTLAVRLEPGSLLVMRASVQDDWMHALLPGPAAAPRISLTFRHIVDASPGQSG